MNPLPNNEEAQVSNDDRMEAMAEALDRDRADRGEPAEVRDEQMEAMAAALNREWLERPRTVYVQVVGDGDPPFGAGHLPPGAAGPGWHGLDEEALTAAHCAIETELVALRDARISVTGPANGFVVRERNTDYCGIMRLGTRDGTAIGIAAYLDCIMAKASDGWIGLGHYLSAKGWV